MIAYYLKIAIRSAKRNKLYVALSIVGLSLGLCAALLIGLYVNDELSYDTWIPGYEEIYRANPVFNERRARGSPSELGLWLRQDYPQATAVARLFNSNSVVSAANSGDREQYNEDIVWADATVFDVFPLDVQYGELTGSLEEPSSVVISQEIAVKYFGNANPVGETLLFDNREPMLVTAVFEDLPPNTHLEFDILGSSNTLFSPSAVQDRNPVQGYFGSKLWGSSTYLRVPSPQAAQSIAADLDAMMDRHLPVEDGRKNSEIYDIELLSVSDIHLSGPNANQVRENIVAVYTVAAIAVLILFTATINYVNLMTARGSKRAREIAIRKTVGADRSHLISQFMIESSGYVLLSAVVATALAYLLLPAFNNFLSREMAFVSLISPQFLSIATLILVATIVLAGFYPAQVLSRFTAINLFRQEIPAVGKLSVRSVLSVVQFSILTGLIISAYVIFEQARFGISESLRDIDDPVVVIRGECSDALRQRFSSLPEVENVACVAQIPQYGLGMSVTMSPKNPELNNSVGVSYDPVDFGFFDLIDVDLVAGRSFDAERTGDRAPENNEWLLPQSIVINETLVRDIGFESPAQAVGSIVEWAHIFRFPNEFTPLHDAEIIGVVEDFQIGSVTRAIPGAAFYVHRNPEITRQVLVRVSGRNLPGTLEAIDRLWDETVGTGPISRHFLDQGIENMYRSISRQSQLLSVYAGIAISIAMLGLFGLAAFVTEKRTKEIGVRKVLGGTTTDIVKLLLWQFSVPVLLSNIVAWPVAFFYLSNWLQGFQSHIELNLWVFVIAGMLTLMIALVTVVSHAFVVASRNPVNALRYE